MADKITPVMTPADWEPRSSRRHRMRARRQRAERERVRALAWRIDTPAHARAFADALLGDLANSAPPVT